MTDQPPRTHTERKNPQISVRYLADYMGASRQASRRIVRDAKYRPTVRVIQHTDARKIISDYIVSPNRNVEFLEARLEALKSKVCDSPFDEQVLQHNCDYVARFIKISESIELPEAQFFHPTSRPSITLNGTRVPFSPDLYATRVTRRNTVKTGAIMLRYSKGNKLSPLVADHQSAFSHAFLEDNPIVEEGTPERSLCLVIDAFAGVAYEAPSNSRYLFNEMKAECETIAERWPKIKPPKNAVL